MPPRYAYWTIVVDNQPTAFRSASVEELIPTFNRLKARQPTAVLKWCQDGKMWDSRLEAREAQFQRGQEGRRRDKHQQSRPSSLKRDGGARPGFKRDDGGRSRARRDPSDREGGKLEWKPKGSGAAPREQRPPKLEWSPRPTGDASPVEKKPRPPYERKSRPPFKSHSQPGEERPRDAKWRPGGDHRDPRQKYKDAKKAKWTRVKEAIRRRRSPRKP